MAVSMKKIKAIIAISQEANRILNIVKAKHDLKTKSEAIEKAVEEYVKNHPRFLTLENSDKNSLNLKHVPHSYHKEQEIKKFRELYG